MKRILISIATLAGIGFAVAHPPIQSPVKSQLLKEYDRVTHDFKTQNSKDYASMLTANYVLVNQGHEMKKAAVVSDFAHQSANVHMKSWTRAITSMKSKGKEVMVVVTGHFVGTFAGTSTFDLHAVSLDTWTKQNKVWMLEKSVVQSMHAKVNGKPAN